MSVNRKSWGKIKPPAGSGLDFSNPINRGLLARWLFNDGGGAKVSDAVKKHTANGSTVNAPTMTGSVIGPALALNGTTQRVEVTQPSGMDYDKLGGWNMHGDVSVMMWTHYGGYTSQGSSLNALCGRLDIASAYGYGIYTASDNIPRFSYGWQTAQSGGASIADGRMHFLVGVRRGTATEMWVDGKKLTNGTSVNPLTAQSGATFYIGRDNLTSRYANCRVAQVGVYDRALQPSEILTLFANPYEGVITPRRRIISQVDAGGGPAFIAPPPYIISQSINRAASY